MEFCVFNALKLFSFFDDMNIKLFSIVNSQTVDDDDHFRSFSVKLKSEDSFLFLLLLRQNEA